MIKQCSALLLIFLLLGCHAHTGQKESVPQPQNYPSELQTTFGEAGFTIDEKTRTMVYEFRAPFPGEDIWAIPVGEMLRDYINNVVSYSFRVLQEDDADKMPLHIHFRINHYKFEDCHATVDMSISVRNGAVMLLNKEYVAQGQAAHQSTHLAFNAIFKDFLSDFIQTVNDKR